MAIQLRMALACMAAALLAACGGYEPDQLRTVKSYSIGSCESAVLTDAMEREAVERFTSAVRDEYFVATPGLLTAASHESSAAASGVRQYSAPFYYYVHPRRLRDADRERGVDWAGVVFLHADRVRTRLNGGDWGGWQRVRTRNFTDQTRGADGLKRWQCLKYAEIAWADVVHDRDGWTVHPLAATVYEQPELHRLRPLASQAQAAGSEPVEAGRP